MNRFWNAGIEKSILNRRVEKVSVPVIQIARVCLHEDGTSGSASIRHVGGEQSNPNRSTSQNRFVNMNWKENLSEINLVVVKIGRVVETSGSASSTAIFPITLVCSVLPFFFFVIIDAFVVIHVVIL